MRLRLSRRAQTDLDDIRDYSLERYGATQAIAYLDAVEHSLRRVLTHPQIGAAQDWLAPALRSLPVGEHRLYYRVEGDEIVIVRVLHKAMDVRRWV